MQLTLPSKNSETRLLEKALELKCNFETRPVLGQTVFETLTQKPDAWMWSLSSLSHSFTSSKGISSILSPVQASSMCQCSLL